MFPVSILKELKIARKKSIVKLFYKCKRIIAKNTHSFEKITSYIFRMMFAKNAVWKVLENSQKNVFTGVPFQQLQLPNLPPATALKTGTAVNVSWNF